MEKMSTVYLNRKKYSKVGFLCSLLFYSHNIAVVNGVANYDRLQNSLGHGEHIHF